MVVSIWLIARICRCAYHLVVESGAQEDALDGESEQSLASHSTPKGHFLNESFQLIVLLVLSTKP